MYDLEEFVMNLEINLIYRHDLELEHICEFIINVSISYVLFFFASITNHHDIILLFIINTSLNYCTLILNKN